MLAGCKLFVQLVILFFAPLSASIFRVQISTRFQRNFWGSLLHGTIFCRPCLFPSIAWDHSSYTFYAHKKSLESILSQWDCCVLFRHDNKSYRHYRHRRQYQKDLNRFGLTVDLKGTKHIAVEKYFCLY